MAATRGETAPRARPRLPSIGDDPAWTVAPDDSPLQGRVNESLLTLADGFVGTRGSPDITRPDSTPAVFVSGLYTGREVPVLLLGPQWTGLDLAAVDTTRCLLDLRTGALMTEQSGTGGTVRSFRFVSLARPGCSVLLAEGPADMLTAGAALRPPEAQPDIIVWADHDGAITRMTVTGSTGAVIAAATSQFTTESDGGSRTRTIERIAVFAANASDHERERTEEDASAAVLTVAARELAQAGDVGFDQLWSEHRSMWAARWDDAAISIEGDPVIEFGVRFATFHLLSSVRSEGEAAVGARGLSGSAYGGHVFWDADVFMLPAVAAMNPAAARAMLEYRIRRLDPARRNASVHGRDGARFPWESAGDGDDVTPREFRDPNGHVVPIYTGELEEHIVADVAWAAMHYAEWSGDAAFLCGPGACLVADAARYWASRVRFDTIGRAHIDNVIGPDEYHESVDDNAFTNVMARWNLRAAAELVDGVAASAGTPEEAESWRRVAGALVDGFEPATHRYEQFAGFSALEPLRISEMTDTPVAADIFLGADRVKAAQVIKQADVVMLHHLVPEAVEQDSLGANLDYYLPRTAHGSSLSPAIHASLLARAGRPDEGRELLALACRVDLDDLTDMTAGGLHLATMGGVWQAIVFGFAGVRANAGVLTVDPSLPSAWTQLDVRLLYRGRRLRLILTPDEIDVRTDGPLSMRFGAGPPNRQKTQALLQPGGVFVRRLSHWERKPS